MDLAWSNIVNTSSSSSTCGCVYVCIYVYVRIYVYIWHSLSISFCFRIMEGKFHGKGYIARIKNEDSFEAYDELYAVVYKGKDTVNFNPFKSICCTHNPKFFYPQKVNNKSSFTIEEAITAMNNYPMKVTLSATLFLLLSLFFSL